MRNRELYEAEMIIKDHFKNMKELERLKTKLLQTKKDIDILKHRINNNDIELNVDIKSPSLSGGGCGSVISKLDQALEKAYNKLIDRLAIKIEEMIFLEEEIEKLIEVTEEIENIIKKLKYSIKEIIIYRYDKKYSMRYIASNYYGGAEASAYRDRNRALTAISKWNKENNSYTTCETI